MVFFTSWWYNWWYGVEKMGALNAYANALPLTGPYDSVQLGNLKKIDEMLNSPGFVTKTSTGLQVHLTMLLRERAMIALPEDTAALLQVYSSALQCSCFILLPKGRNKVREICPRPQNVVKWC